MKAKRVKLIDGHPGGEIVADPPPGRPRPVPENSNASSPRSRTLRVTETEASPTGK